MPEQHCRVCHGTRAIADHVGMSDSLAATKMPINHLWPPLGKRQRMLIAVIQLIGLVCGTRVVATPLLRIVQLEPLDRPHQWRVVISAEQPRSLESSDGPTTSRPLGIYTFRINCASGWLRDVSGANAQAPKPLSQQRGYPTGVPQAAFAAACGVAKQPDSTH